MERIEFRSGSMNYYDYGFGSLLFPKMVGLSPKIWWVLVNSVYDTLVDSYYGRESCLGRSQIPRWTFFFQIEKARCGVS